MARNAIAAFNARDIEAFAALTAPEFEWVPSMSPIEAETFRGREGIDRYFELLDTAWEHFHVLPEEFRRGEAGAQRSALVGGARDVQGGLIQGGEEHVREHLVLAGWDAAVAGQAPQGGPQPAERVLLVERAPARPAEHGGRIQQRDPL